MTSIESPLVLDIHSSSISYTLGCCLNQPVITENADEPNVLLKAHYQPVFIEDNLESGDTANPENLYVTTAHTLEKMIAMGLGSLPVNAILVPIDCFKDNDSLAHILGMSFTGEVRTFDISGNLSKYFPGHFVVALYELQSILNKADMSGYVIGGITRDLLMTQEKRFELQDVDITIEGDIETFIKLLQEFSKNFTVNEIYPDFGTAKIQYKESLAFDIASTRKEVYANCGALPDVVNKGVPLTQDILRRDFTINALSLSITNLGQVLDYTHGLEDIEDGLIRILHPVSFYEDPSRILRAFKFAGRFGFALSDDTQYLLKQFLTYGDKCYKGGGERIKQELKGLLSVQECVSKHETIAQFIDSGGMRLLNMGLPPSALDGRALMVMLDTCAGLPFILDKVHDYTKSDKKNFLFRFYLCFLLGSLEETPFEETAHRLGLTRAERESVEQFKRLRHNKQLSGIDEYTSSAELVEIFKGKPVSSLTAAMAAMALEQPEKLEIWLNALTAYKKRWEHITLELNGHDLMELGVPEGKTLGIAMNQLLRAKLSGMVHERMDEIRFVKEKLLPKLKTKVEEAEETE